MSQELKNQDTGEEDVLTYTQGMRRRLIGDMIKSGDMPTDNKDRITLLAALDGMDRQELGRQKIDATKNSSASDRLVAGALMALMNKELRGGNPFEQDPAQTEGRRQPLPALTLDGLDVVPGETDIGLSDDNLLTFARRTGLDLSSIAGAGDSQGSIEFAEKTENP